MFKLVVLSAFIALTVAAPSGLHGVAPLITAHSAVVGSVPTSISSQSSSVVHSAALVHAAPAVAVHAAPAVHHVAVHPAPVVAAHAAPVVTAHSAIVGSVPTSISSQSSSVVHGASLAHAAPALAVAAHSPVLGYSAPALVSSYGTYGGLLNAW